MANYVSYADILKITREIGRKFDLLGGAFVIKGAKAFASLPTPSAKTIGFVYNVTDAFTTTSAFVEGADKDYPAGTNVVVVDNSSKSFTAVDSATLAGITSPKDERYYELTSSSNGEYVLSADTTVNSEKTYYTVTAGTPDYKYDILAGFIDVEALTDRIDTTVSNLAPAFDVSQSYEVGDTVIYEDVLYTCSTARSAGAWDAADFTPIKVNNLINSAEPSSLTENQMDDLIGLL